MIKYLFLCLLVFTVLSCSSSSEAVSCQDDSGCDPASQYCDKLNGFTDEAGISWGSCIDALLCPDGTCDAGFECDTNGYCKPLTGKPDKDGAAADNYVPAEQDNASPEKDSAIPAEQDTFIPDNTINDNTITDNTISDNTSAENDTPAQESDPGIVTDNTADSDTPAIDADTVDEDIVDVTQPTAVFTSPGDGSISANLKPNIVITFSEAIDKATVIADDTIKFTPSFTFTTSWNLSSTVLTITPDADIASESNSLTLTVGIKDKAGNALDKEYSWSFVLGTLTVTSKTPDDGTAGVPVASDIVVTFSKPVDDTTVTPASFMVSPAGGSAVAGVFTFNTEKTIATFNPDTDLVSDKEYTVSLTNAIKTASKILLTPASWKFKTPDTIPPTVVSSVPANGEQNANFGAITVVFSEAVKNIDTAAITLVKVSDSTALTITPSLSTDKKTATITPSPNLITNTEYRLTLNPDGANPLISDLSNNPLAKTVITFKTAAYGFKELSAGGVMTCAIDMQDKLWCWGRNYYGQLGIGNTTDKHVPTKISDDTWLKVSAGMFHVCGIKTGGALYCWGDNENSKLGTGNTTDKSTPTAVSNGGIWKTVAAGTDHTCGIKSDDTLWCWGDNYYGELGLASEPGVSNVPAQVAIGTTWKTISTGAYSSCAIKSDNTLWCWGDNSYGGLGIGNTTMKYTPVKESTASTNWAAVTVGRLHTCAIKDDKSFFCWGYNNKGQITGSGNKTNPTVIGSAMWNDTSAGSYNTCGIQSDSSLWCWGDNELGELGIGNTTNKSTPTQVGTSLNWIKISAGGTYISSSYYYHTCAINSANQLYCWGDNEFGQIGDNSTSTRNAPVFIKHPDQPNPPVPVPTPNSESFLQRFFLGFLSVIFQ